MHSNAEYPFRLACVPTHDERRHNSIGEPITQAFYDHSSAARVSSEAAIFAAIRAEYPRAHVSYTSVDILGFAAPGKAQAVPIVDEEQRLTEPLRPRLYAAPVRRLDGNDGAVVAGQIVYGKFSYSWKGHNWILYAVDGRDGTQSFPAMSLRFLVSGSAAPKDLDDSPKLSQGSEEELQEWDDALIKEAGKYSIELRDEIWVYDQGYWQKDPQLFKAVAKASWDDVILDADMKKSLQKEVQRFFDGRQRYQRLRVPWKRGLIYHGPPGNGKTVSIKALMHTLYQRKDPVPTLYVRSLASYGGPELSIKTIFAKARQTAPCMLVFEDIDSLVSPDVRSYFLNEVDGLAANDGILMIGSTNHLDQLDPGISQRPSRFDRKFFFPMPNKKERTLYAEYWRKKLAGGTKGDAVSSPVTPVNISDGFDVIPDEVEPEEGSEIEFPKALCPRIAEITHGFSFAYLQEAFIASLLAIATEDDDDEDKGNSAVSNEDDDDDDLKHLRFWKEIKKQIEILRKEL